MLKKLILFLLKKTGTIYIFSRWKSKCKLFSTALVHRIRYSCTYSAKGYICNFCSSKYKKFMPLFPEKNVMKFLNEKQIISGYGMNNICPACFSSSRDRLVKATVDKFFLKKGAKILLFAPSIHEYQALSAIGNVTCCDINKHLYQHIDKNTLEYDIRSLQFKDETFEYVVANHVLEHVLDDLIAIKEIYRVLKPNGLALLQIPYTDVAKNEDNELKDENLSEVDRLLRFGQSDHVRVYYSDSYVDKLQSCNFQVSIESQNNNGNIDHAFQKNEKIFLVRK